MNNPAPAILGAMPLTDWRGSLSTFKGFTGTTPATEVSNGTWPELAAILCPAQPAVSASKMGGQFVVPCLLKEAPLVGKTLEAAQENGNPTVGKMRSKQHVTEAGFAIMDVDGLPEADFMAGLEKLKLTGVTYLAYTTYSHGTPGKEGVRARVCVPIDIPVGTNDYAAVWHGLDACYWNGQAGAKDSSGANLYQQQGAWATCTLLVPHAQPWANQGGVASSAALMEIGKATEVFQVGQKHSAHTDNPVKDAGTTGNTLAEDFPPADANQVADRCKQIGEFRDTKGADQGEPTWRDCLGVVGYCIDGEAIAQDWSSGHAEYSERETARKLEYRLKVPPTTCAQFRVSNSAGCQGCTQRCKSPITLGWAAKKRDDFSDVDSAAEAAAKLAKANAVVTKLIVEIKDDSAAILEDESVAALATIQQHKPADYQRARNALKLANKGVSLATMDRAVKTHVSEIETAQTHNGYAKYLLAELTEKVWKPVGHQGALYVLNPDSCIWERKPAGALILSVAEAHDGKKNCERSSDYRAVAELATTLASDDSYFADGPIGVACPGGFYQIKDNAINLVPLTPDHRQRVMLPFIPESMPIPEFEGFLHATFKSEHEGEEQQQITLLQEIAGGIMLGIVHKYQVAILFYEPFGRAGKGTLEKQFRALVPKEFVSAISPFKWHHDYHVATLAGKRLNVVGELPENEPIPAAAFKSVIGSDLITGRHPTHRPITFTNEATHLFMSNHLITTKDQSDAFFARWKIVEFPNSRLRSGLPLDGNLAQRIIDNELPGIAYWALEGAARLLKNGKFSDSTAHDRLMAKWRRTTNTLEEFIHECCDLSQEGTYKRSDLSRCQQQEQENPRGAAERFRVVGAGGNRHSGRGRSGIRQSGNGGSLHAGNACLVSHTQAGWSSASAYP